MSNIQNKYFFLFGIFIFFGLTFFASPADAATYTCNSCADCTTKINNASAGDVVKLMRNLWFPRDTRVCIEWQTSGVTFSCGRRTGCSVDPGNSRASFVKLVGDNNTMSTFLYPFWILKRIRAPLVIDILGSNNLLHGIVIDGRWAHQGYAIAISGGVNNTISDSSIYKGGVLLRNTENNTIINSSFAHLRYGVTFASNSHNNTLFFNRVCQP